MLSALVCILISVSTESETAIYNLVVSNKLRNNLYSKASLLVQALFIDFRNVSLMTILSPSSWLKRDFDQKRAAAKAALISKKQNFQTAVRTLLLTFNEFNAIKCTVCSHKLIFIDGHLVCS